MRNRRFLTVCVVAIAFIFSTFQALAQIPIDRWLGAYFGMTPEELRDAYKEEENEHNNTYRQQMEYIEKNYTNDPEELKRQKEWMENNMKGFWIELTEEDVPGLSHQLVTLRLEPILSLGELGAQSVDFFSFGENGLYEIRTMMTIKIILDFWLPQVMEEQEIEENIEKAVKLSDQMWENLDFFWSLMQERWGEGEDVEKDGEACWQWNDVDDNTINLNPNTFGFSHNEKEYSLCSGWSLVCSGTRAAAVHITLREYIGQPCKPEEVFTKAWEKFRAEAWGTPHPATAEEAAEATLSGEPLPPVPLQYNDWIKRMENVKYEQVPDFDRPLAAFLTIGGRTIRSFGNPTEVEKMMDVPAIRKNDPLVTILGLGEDLESWNAAKFKERSFSAKFAAYLALTQSVVTSDELKDFIFTNWLYSHLQPKKQANDISLSEKNEAPK